MMTERISKKMWFVMTFVVALSFSTSNLNAQIALLNGVSDIVAGKTIELQDELLNNTVTGLNSLTSNNRFNQSISTVVKLQYDELNVSKSSGDFQVTIDFELREFDVNNVLIATTVNSLNIAYSTLSSSLTNLASFKSGLSGVHRATLEVLNVTGASGISDDLYLTLEFKKIDVGAFSTDISTLVNSKSIDVIAKELEINWGYHHGADGYELEWVFVSEEVAPVNQTVINADIFINATRVVTSDQHYIVGIPMNGNGTIYYRLRGFRNAIPNVISKKYSKWLGSTGFLNENINATDYITNYSGNMSWSYTSVYSSDGVKGEQIAYIDATGRTRQMIVKDNENDNVIVGEQKYGFNGEPMIQILPGILEGKDLSYREDFVKIGGQPFTKDHYATNAGLFNPPAIDNTNQYFSSANPFIGDGLHDYVADAEGYGYVQSMFDAQGRVNSVSGIGPNHKLGSGHEVKIWYGAPSQEELDRLFGNEVGFAKHYSKVQTKDANGVVKISYYNLSDQLIGTAIVGNPAENLDPITTNNYDQTENREYHLNSHNALVAGENSTVINYDFLSSTAQEYDLKYTLTREWYEENCTGNTQYECKYILELFVSDEQGEKVALTVPSDQSLVGTDNVIRKKLSGADFTGSPGVDYELEYKADLGVGQYKVWKKLMVDPEGFVASKLAYIAELEAGNTTCIDPLSSYVTKYEDLYLQGVRCDECESDCAELVNRYYEFTAGLEQGGGITWAGIIGGTDDLSLLESLTSYENWESNLAPASGISQVWVAKFDECVVDVCDKDKEVFETKPPSGIDACDGIKKLLISDLQPGGQYFDNRGVGEKLDIANNSWVYDNIPTGSWPSRKNGFRLEYPDPEDPTDTKKFSNWGPKNTDITVPDQDFNLTDFSGTSDVDDANSDTEDPDNYVGIYKNFQYGEWGEDDDIDKQWWRYHPEVCEYVYCDATKLYNFSNVLIEKLTYVQAAQLFGGNPFNNVLHKQDVLATTDVSDEDIKDRINDIMDDGDIENGAGNQSVGDLYNGDYKFIVEDGNGALIGGHIYSYYQYLTNPNTSCSGAVGMTAVAECLASSIHGTTLTINDVNIENREKVWKVYKTLYLSARGAFLAQNKTKFKEAFGGTCQIIANSITAPVTDPSKMISGDALYTYTSGTYGKDFEIKIPDLTKFAMASQSAGGSFPSGAGALAGIPNEPLLLNFNQVGGSTPANITSGVVQGMIDDAVNNKPCYDDPEYEWPSGNHWYHGAGGLINFSSGDGSAKSQNVLLDKYWQYASYEATATLSDDAGQLLYYSNGQFILDSKGIALTDGNGTPIQLLAGNDVGTGSLGTSAVQGVQFVRHADDSDKLYVITVDDDLTPDNEEQGANVWVIQISTGALLSGPIRLKTDLDQDFRPTEKQTATLHQNGSDIWILIGESGKYSNAEDYRNVYSYKLTVNGINPIATAKSILPTYQTYSIYTGDPFDRGAIRVSWDGTKVAMVSHITSLYWADKSLVVADFDNLTGTFSNAKDCGLQGPGGGSLNPAHKRFISGYDCEFSPDSKGLYVTGVVNAAQGDNGQTTEGPNYMPLDPNNGLVFFDLTSNNADQILNSFRVIDGGSNYSGRDYQRDIKIGSDKRLYIAQELSDHIYYFDGDLNNPTSLNLSGQFQDVNLIKKQADVSGNDAQSRLGFSNTFAPPVCKAVPINCFCDQLLTIRNEVWYEANGIPAPSSFTASYVDQANQNVIGDELLKANIVDKYHALYSKITEITLVGSNEYDQTLVPNYVSDFHIGRWVPSCLNGQTAFLTGDESGPSSLTPAPELLIDCPKIDCKEELREKAYTDAVTEWKNDIYNKANEFGEGYYDRCIQGSGSMKEDISISFSTRESQYTLYYYDLVGNLVATVYPEGVRPLDPDVQADQLKLDAIKEYRSNPEGAATPVFLEDQHLISQTNKFTYNTLGEVLVSEMVDGGKSEYFYDDLGRIVASQDADQAELAGLGGSTTFRYNYTKYDHLGRISESGEMSMGSNLFPLSQDISRGKPGNSYLFSEWLRFGDHQEVTKVYYDFPEDAGTSDAAAEFATRGINTGQRFNRNRINKVEYYENEPAYDSTVDNFTMAYYYSYNEHGLVESFLQEHAVLTEVPQRFKIVNYDFDLFSGLVKKVSYQPGKEDQFYTQYDYDRLNRLKRTYTSTDGENWNLDGKNIYYNHGAKARIELGKHQIQGLDIAYTVRGEVKALNSSTLNARRDIGGDGSLSSINGLSNAIHKTSNKDFARDAAGFSLNYFSGDFSSIGGISSNDMFEASVSSWSAAGSQKKDLYNGVITASTTAIHNRTTTGDVFAESQFSTYKYDELYRLKEVQVFRGGGALSSNNWDNASLEGPTKEQSSYYSKINYDLNGNITSLKRNTEFDGSTSAMDDMEYTYDKITNGALEDLQSNMLYHVKDNVVHNGADYNGNNGAITTNSFATKTQNYFRYNASGYIIENKADGYKVSWTANRKVKTIERYDDVPGPNIEFKYDAFGRRIAKIIKDREDANNNGVYSEVNPMGWKHQYYGLDASGNQMAVYEHNLISSISQGCQAGKSVAVVGVSNGYNGGGTLTATIATPGLSSKNYVLDNSTESYASNLVSQINGDVNSEIAAQLLGGNGAYILLESKVEGIQNDGTTISVSDGSIQPQSILVKSFSGGHNTVASCSAVLNSKLQEHIIYADSRLGVKRYNKVLNVAQSSTQNEIVSGDRFYQITNWLGSVISVVRDMKFLETNDITVNSSFEGGDDNLFSSWNPYTNNLIATDQGTGGIGTDAILLDGTNYQWGPTIKSRVYQGDAVQNVSIQAKVIQPVSNTAKNGGNLKRCLIDQNGQLLYLDQAGQVAEWSGIDAQSNNSAWQTLSFNSDLTVPNTLYKKIGVNSFQAIDWSVDEVHVFVFAWMPGDAINGFNNATYFDDFTIDVSGSSHGDYYAAVIHESADYHEFGQRMEGRGFQAATGGYRYGYQGSEMDNEVSGNGNSYTTEFRQLDPRLGRWFSPDPVFQPWQSPYTSMDNDPINLNDELGLKTGNKKKRFKDRKKVKKNDEGESSLLKRLWTNVKSTLVNVFSRKTFNGLRKVHSAQDGGENPSISKPKFRGRTSKGGRKVDGHGGVEGVPPSKRFFYMLHDIREFLAVNFGKGHPRRKIPGGRNVERSVLIGRRFNVTLGPSGTTDRIFTLPANIATDDITDVDLDSGSGWAGAWAAPNWKNTWRLLGGLFLGRVGAVHKPIYARGTGGSPKTSFSGKPPKGTVRVGLRFRNSTGAYWNWIGQVRVWYKSYMRYNTTTNKRPWWHKWIYGTR